MIQIDMPMPNRCNECPFASADFYNGIVSLSCITPTGRSMYAPDLIDRRDRPDWCPLKEQEAVEPRWFIDAHNPAGAFVCSACGERIIEKNIDFYCSKCGKPITWAKMEGR